MRLSWAVLIAALALASVDAAHFLDDPAAIFDGLAHDRNHHLLRAQRLAVDLRDADPIGWLHDFDRSRLWPPLHAVLASIPLALSGLDYRTAVLPSWLGFVATCALAFGCARRAASGGQGGYAALAGFVAFVFVAASPSHHRFATDVMLESLGAALTLACLYFFLGCIGGGRRGAAARGLGLCLTLLLVTKYNYYAVALAGILAAAAAAAGSAKLRELWELGSSHRTGLVREARHPLVVLGGLLWLAALAVSLTGGGSFEVLGQRVSVRSSFNLVHAGYLAILVRVLWRGRGRWRSGVAALPPPWRRLVVWHAIPLAVWFALPRRLGYFLHHVSPANAPGSDGSGLVEHWVAYGEAFVRDFHASTPGAVLALALGIVALVSARRLSPRGRACLVFAGVAAVATALHPNAQSRFLHSWIAVVWIVAALGAHRLAVVGGRPAALAVTAGLAAYAALTAWTGLPPRPLAAPSVLALTDAYGPALPPGPVAFVANHPAEELVEWRFVASGRARDELHVYTPRRRETRAEREARFRAWLADCPADTLIFLDVGPASPWHAPGFATYEELTGFVRSQTEYRTRAEPRSAGPGVTWETLSRYP